MSKNVGQTYKVHAFDAAFAKLGPSHTTVETTDSKMVFPFSLHERVLHRYQIIHKNLTQRNNELFLIHIILKAKCDVGMKQLIFVPVFVLTGDVGEGEAMSSNSWGDNWCRRYSSFSFWVMSPLQTTPSTYTNSLKLIMLSLLSSRNCQ